MLQLSLDELMQYTIEKSLPTDIHHVHKKGELMLSYKYMMMSMEGSRSATQRVSDQEVLEQYPVTPTQMTMHMHMLGLMYAPADFVTVMAMIPYKKLSMKHLNKMGMRFTTHSQGLGDIMFSSLWKLKNSSSSQLFATVGVSVPTGSIDQKDDLPTGPDQQLPYPMQLGSGTVDPVAGITAIAQAGEGTVGIHAVGIFRVYRNDNDYQLGDVYKTTLWYSHIGSDYFSYSLQLDGMDWDDIRGADPKLNPAMVPTADASIRGGRRCDLGASLNVNVSSDLQLTFRASVPLYQKFDGPQLETDHSLMFGVSRAY